MKKLHEIPPLPINDTIIVQVFRRKGNRHCRKLKTSHLRRIKQLLRKFEAQDLDDAIGLLPSTALTEAGYRLYDDTALEDQIKLLELRRKQLDRNYEMSICQAGLAMK